MSIANAAHHSLIGGGKKWVNPYVTDGLIAMWDGEWNAGGGVHNSSTNKICDIANVVGDCELSGMFTINANSVSFNGGYGIAPKYDFTNASGATISYLASFTSNTRLNSCGWSVAGDHPRLAPYYERGQWYLSAGSGLPSNIYVPLVANVLTKWDFVWDIANQHVYVYKDGAYAGQKTQDTPLSNPDNRFRMFAYGAKGDNSNYQVYDGVLYTCTVYNRALTAQEIAANYAVDAQRFNLPTA